MDRTAVSNIIKLKLNEVSTLQEKLQNSKPTKFCQQNHINTCLFGEQSILSFKRKNPTFRRAKSE